MPRRGENIHKRTDGRWEGRYIKNRELNGRAHYASVYAKSYKEVKIKLRNAHLSISEEKNNDLLETKITFQKVLAMWLDHNRLKLKGATIHKYQYLIETHIKPDLGSIYITEITSSTINVYLDSKLKKGRLNQKGGLSPSYIRTIAIIISSAIDFAVKERLRLPMKTEILKPVLIKHELVVLSIEEQFQLENFLLENLCHTCLGIYISLNTGLRIGEVCALMWKNVDLEQGIIYVRATTARVLDDTIAKRNKWIIDVPKTRSSNRDIPISCKLKKILMTMKKTNVSPYVISDHEGFINPRTYEYRYHKILEQANIRNVNYHVLRHTFATRCIEAGVDVKSLSEILGHANVSITLDTYVHSSLELKRKQLEKVSTIIKS